MTTHGRLKLAYLHGGVVDYRSGETLGPRILPDYELVLIIEGNVTYQVDQHNYRAPPGSIILARPGFHEAYRWDPIGPTRHAFFHFDIDMMSDQWPNTSSWPIVRTQPDPVLPGLFRHVLNRIYRHWDWPARPPAGDDCGVVETLISLFLEEHSSDLADCERSRPLAVQRVIRYMRQAIDEDPRKLPNLGQLAAIAGVNEKHLCRLFQKSLGYSPMHTYRLLCLQLSLALLSRSNLTIKQIAYRCGFDDPGYFSRCFSAVFGRSPRKVRQELSQGLLPPTSPLPADVSPRICW